MDVKIEVYEQLVKSSIKNQALLQKVLELLVEEKSIRTGKNRAELLEEIIYEVGTINKKLLEGLPFDVR